MLNRSDSPYGLATSLVQIVVLHDDHLTAARGTQVARSIADEMGLGTERNTRLWNVELLDTGFAPLAEADTSRADLLIVALRAKAKFSESLKLWLRHWLVQTRNTSAAMLVVFENGEEPSSRDTRAFIERAARSAGKDFFTEPADLSSITASSALHEFLWVL